MTTPIETTVDPFDAASNPPERTYDLFGKVEISAWACALVKGQGKVAHDPAVHSQRFTAIDIFIQPLPEIDVKYPRSLEVHEIAEFAPWAKIVLPSIKALGISNVREINGKWARVARVPNGKQYEKKDKLTGQGTGEMADELTFKFVQFFDTEDACRAAYVAAGGAPGSGSNGNGNVPIDIGNKVPHEVDIETAERATAKAFLKVIVTNAVRDQTDWNQAKTLVAEAIAKYPPVAKYFNADSQETIELMSAANDKILPF